MQTLSPLTRSLPSRMSGFELGAARERLGGNERLLVDLLERFVAEHGGAAAEVDALVAAVQPAHAVAALHRLKGAARIVGADTLSAAAQAAEEGLLHGDRGALAAFRSALADTLASIRTALCEGPPR